MPVFTPYAGYGQQAVADSLSVVMSYGATIKSGEQASGSVATNMPNVPCQLAWLRARDTNTGTIYLGVSGVTVPDGTTDTTSGIALPAGEPFGPIPIDNLNRLWHIANAQSQSLLYFTVK